MRSLETVTNGIIVGSQQLPADLHAGRWRSTRLWAARLRHAPRAATEDGGAKAGRCWELADQIEAQASYPQPPGCLPVAVGMALDQLLTKLRMAADIDVAESFDKSETSLRALSDASLYEITEHVYDNLEQVVEQLKWRWRAENADFAERANAWRWRRQGWFLLLGESEEGSVLVTAVRELTFVVRGMEMSLSAKLRTKLPDAELPAAVWLTLLPWEGYITYDGLMACRALPAAPRAKLRAELQPQYEMARDSSTSTARAAAQQARRCGRRRGGRGLQGAPTEEKCIERRPCPSGHAFGGDAMAQEGHKSTTATTAAAAAARRARRAARRRRPPACAVRPELARYAPLPCWRARG